MPAIDDFGAGYSGLNLLAGFQPAIIKLDRQLIEEIHLSLPKQAIVRGVLSVCRDLNILPIAEGVEEIEEYLALRELGIDVFQGYLFAHPGFEALPVPVYPD
jgi:EAL domain-containing protein (putative c-di-GMP-specific phosphodiesterase class I)